MLKLCIYIGLLLLFLEQFLKCDLLGESMHFKIFDEGEKLSEYILALNN